MGLRPGGCCANKPVLTRLSSRSDVRALVAPLRPYNITLAPDALGGGGIWDDFGHDRLRSRQECVEKQCGRQKPKVDRSTEHWAVPTFGDRNADQHARNCRGRPSGSLRDRVFTMNGLPSRINARQKKMRAPAFMPILGSGC